MDEMKLPCSEWQGQIADDDPVLKTPALKNPFCRRSGQDKRSGKERRTSVKSIIYHGNRRSGVDRRKGQERRKHDYWNTNYRYYYYGKVE